MTEDKLYNRVYNEKNSPPCVKCDFCNFFRTEKQVDTENPSMTCGHYGAPAFTALYTMCEVSCPEFDVFLETKRKCKWYNKNETKKVEWAEKYGQCFCDRLKSYLRCHGDKCDHYKNGMPVSFSLVDLK